MSQQKNKVLRLLGDRLGLRNLAKNIKGYFWLKYPAPKLKTYQKWVV